MNVRCHTYVLREWCRIVHSLLMPLRVNKTSQAILEEYFHLSGLYQSRHFSDTKHLMRHRLARTVCECSVIR